MPKKVAPSIFCEFFDKFHWQKRQNFRIFWHFLTNFRQRNVFSLPPNEDHAKMAPIFESFDFFDKFRQISLRERLFPPLPKKIMPKWCQFSNFLPIFCQISLTETFPIKIFKFFVIFWQISTNSNKFLWEKRFPPLPMKIKPKWRQFSNFLPIFCQISLTETFPIKIFEFFDIFWQISTNFTERKAFSFPPNENHAKMAPIFEFFDIFWQISANSSERNVFSPSQWKSCRNAANFGIFDNFWQSADYFAKSGKKFNFGRDLVQKCSKIGQNVQISSASFKKSDKTQQNFQKLAKIFEF